MGLVISSIMVSAALNHSVRARANRSPDARELGPTFFPSRSPEENPYFVNIIQLARTVSPIRFALASSASYHLAKTAQAPHLILQCFKLRGQATRLLRERLQSDRPIERRGSLAAMLILTQLDVNPSWSATQGLIY